MLLSAVVYRCGGQSLSLNGYFEARISPVGRHTILNVIQEGGWDTGTLEQRQIELENVRLVSEREDWRDLRPETFFSRSIQLPSLY
jgi:hypothetical protein